MRPVIKRMPVVALLVLVLLLVNSVSPAFAISLPPAAPVAQVAPKPPSANNGPPYANNFKPSSPSKVYFQECGHYLSMGFLNFWRFNGKYEMLGCHISEEITENGRTVQYFQKARLEYHPEMAGTQWETSLGLLGTEVLAVASSEERENPAYQPVKPFANTASRVYFEVTGHGIGGGFYKFWKERGGLYYFGYPLSEEYPLFIAGIWVSAQDFERTRFIYHPTFGVSVAELGRQASEINKADTTPLGQEEGVPIMTPTAQLWERWVDVNLSKFTATYMEGDLPVRTIWVVTGMYGWDTPVGTFTIFRRVENERMRGGTIGSEDYYDLSNVLYTQYFTAAGHALHYAWWRDSFGYRASHGCVNMNLDDSFFAWNFLKIGSKVNIHY